MITEPKPFDEAIRHLLDKEQLPAEWDAATWREQEADFRTQAFFVSRVENARFVDRAQTLLFDYLAKVREHVTTPDGEQTTALAVADRSHFVERMREFMIAEGMAKPDEFKDVDQKDVEDIRSLARLNLIFDTNVRQAYGYGQWKQGMEPAVLRAFPAARLIRDRGVTTPRPRHQAHLGDVRLKTDLSWWASYQNAKSIGGFEVPWGPYGFNSGVTQEDVSRKEARALGLPVDTAAKGMKETPPITAGTKASTKKMDPELKKKLIRELRNGPKPLSPEEAAREAAANARRIALTRGLEEAEKRGETARADKYRKALADLPQAGLAIVDEGESIRLGDDLGERLSKILKRGDLATPAQQRAIAEKVFEMVDGKAAEPTTRAELGKGADRARHLLADDPTLTPEERKILESPHEILLVHSQEGRLIKARLGDENSVTIPDGVPDGAILSHNHPSGRGPSDADLKFALAHPGMTLRIVAANETGKLEIFVLRATTALSPDEINGIATAYKLQAEEGGDTHAGRRTALALISDIFGDKVVVESRILP